MLAADVSGALRDLEGAEAVLTKFLLEEAVEPDGAAVLGEAALRAGAPKLALEIIERITERDAMRKLAGSASRSTAAGRFLAAFREDRMPDRSYCARARHALRSSQLERGISIDLHSPCDRRELVMRAWRVTEALARRHAGRSAPDVSDGRPRVVV
jgi:hypothetical protein